MTKCKKLEEVCLFGTTYELDNMHKIPKKRRAKKKLLIGGSSIYYLLECLDNAQDKLAIVTPVAMVILKIAAVTTMMTAMMMILVMIVVMMMFMMMNFTGQGILLEKCS